MTAAALTLTMGSCSIDVNNDPNHPTTVDPTLELPAAQNSIAYAVGYDMAIPSGIFVQYFDQLPESEQYGKIVRYVFTQSDGIVDDSYGSLYSDALMDLQDIITSASASAGDKFAAECLRAYSLQLAVDTWDQAPYSDALKGSGSTQPKWDKGEDVYKGVLAELDSLQKNVTSASTMASNDLVNSGNMSRWIGFANALRLRMYLRFIDAGVDAANYEAKAKALVSQNAFFTGDIKFDAYSNEDNRRNPFYTASKVKLNTTNLCASYAMVSYLKATNDTKRLNYDFAASAGSNDVVGTLPAAKYGFQGLKNKNCSELNYYATMPVYFFTQAELQFLIAEVQLRFNNDDSTAKTAYEAGIEADYESRGLTGASAVYNSEAASWDKATTTTAKLKLIYMQKWVSLFYRDHTEAWSEQRRTDVPAWSAATAQQIYNKELEGYSAGDLIKPAVNSLGNDVVKREWFPERAKNYNNNTPAAVSITKPVWWDVK